MKQRELLDRLAEIAKAKGHSLDLVRHGGHHDIYEVGGVRFPVPRHTEIKEGTARAIIKKVEQI